MLPGRRETPQSLCLLGWLFALVYTCFSFVATISFHTNDFSIPPITVSANIYWLFIYLAAFLLYIGFLQLFVISSADRSFSFKHAILFSILFCILLTIQSPIGSIDVNNYAFAARLFNFYHTNPYLEPIVDIASDPYFEYTFDNINPYGPIFTIFIIFIDLVACQNFILTTVLLKLGMVCFFLGSTFILYKILRVIKPEKAKIYSIVFAWNPMVLFEVANNGHNDIMVLFFILLAVYFLINRSYFWIVPLLTVSVLIKYVTILIIPFFIIYIYRFETSFHFWRRVFLTCTLFICLSYYPFLQDDLSIFKALFVVFSQAEFWFHYGAMPLFAYWVNHTFSLGIATAMIKNSLLLTFLIVYSSLYFKKIAGEIQIYKIIFIVYMAYFVIACFWMMPWYFLWILPMPLLFSNDKWKEIILIITLSGLLSYFVPIGGFLMLFLGIYFFKNWTSIINKCNSLFI
jgi:hypothetical protein